MAITLPSGFKVTTNEPIDSRLVLTKTQMLNMVDDKMPDKYICVCSDDGKLYIYNKNKTASATTGKFTEYEEIFDVPAAIAKGMSTPSGKAAIEQAVATTMPGAMAKTLADDTLGGQLVQNMFDNTQFERNVNDKIEFKVSEAIQCIEAIDGMA